MSQSEVNDTINRVNFFFILSHSPDCLVYSLFLLLPLQLVLMMVIGIMAPIAAAAAVALWQRPLMVRKRLNKRLPMMNQKGLHNMQATQFD